MRKYQIAATAVAASGLMVIATSAAQAQGAGGEPPPAGVVSATPVSGTPHLKASDNNPIQQIRQLVQCGNTMYGVGSFFEIVKGITTYTRENVFRTKASGAVQTMVGEGSHLLVGGNFTGVNGDTADPYMVSLSPTTGKSDGFLHLNISGNYQYPGVATNATRVFNQQLSHGGTLDLVEGDFTSVGGLGRQQIFMLNVGGSSASVTGWTSPEFDGSDSSYPYQCATVEPFYIQAAAWSPDDSTVYIGTTGYHANGYPVGQTPRQGLCDAAAAFPATQTSVQHQWVNYTGCDSLYSAAADASGAYFGGHERFSMNANACDGLGN